ncbi:BTAD domain-containing putative transcriptional regulator [Kitasatospora sp. NPDC090091]|uniref:AfsR/SARP family transcriptional regulator n=1 Tax=Kitasatospora sp. NPDC090091 TaxID=3364081 RepID=UPI00380E48C4
MVNPTATAACVTEVGAAVVGSIAAGAAAVGATEVGAKPTGAAADAGRESGRPERPRLRLFGGFDLCCGPERLALPLNSQRLVALLALRVTTSRSQAAGILWPEVSERQASGRLRTTLWRLQRTDRTILDCRGRLALAAGVEVDVTTWARGARRLLDDPDAAAGTALPALRPVGDLLPGWYEDWVLAERERLRQLQLHTLETLSGRLLDQGRPAEALDTALRVVQLDPTRESAHRAAIRVHLAEGNFGEVVRQFDACRTVLRRELGVGPSPLLLALLGAGAAGPERDD